MTGNQRATHRRLLPAITALLILTACGGHEPATRGTAEVTIEAELARAERAQVPSWVELFGTVEAARTAAVSSRIMAMVTAVAVKTGDAVVEGQTLLTIDPRAAEGRLSQARGALAQARAGLALAERNHERFAALAAVDAASALELDIARMEHERARGAVEEASGAVAAAAAVAADWRVMAPFAGRVTAQMVEVGDMAAPGRPLLLLESADGQRLTLMVPESVMAGAGLTIGRTLAVAIDARPDLGTVEGTVVERTPGADPASHSFRVEVALPPAGVPSGSAGRARIETGRRTIVTVPTAAILDRGGLSLVVVRDGDGRAASRVVTLGDKQEEGRIEVLTGLGGGETVLLALDSVPPPGAVVKDKSAERGPGERVPEASS